MSESLRDAFEDCPPDPASDIAVLVMMLEWARGASLNDHCHRYGEVQELADPIIKAAIAAAHAKGRAEGIGEAAQIPALGFLGTTAGDVVRDLLTTGGTDAKR